MSLASSNCLANRQRLQYCSSSGQSCTVASTVGGLPRSVPLLCYPLRAVEWGKDEDGEAHSEKLARGTTMGMCYP